MFNFKKSLRDVLSRSFSVSSRTVIAKTVAQVYLKAATYPLFVSSYNSKNIAYDSFNYVELEVGKKVLGINFFWKGSGRRNRNKSIYYTQTSGILEGMKVHWYFKNLSERSTEVRIRALYRKDRFSGHLLGCIVKRTIKEILRDLKSSTENT